MALPWAKKEKQQISNHEQNPKWSNYCTPGLVFWNACFATNNTSQEIQVCCRCAICIWLYIISPDLGLLKIALLKTISRSRQLAPFERQGLVPIPHYLQLKPNNFILQDLVLFQSIQTHINTSFFPRTIKDWNLLKPPMNVAKSLAIFK